MVLGEEASGTAELFKIVDSFFDSLNVRNLDQAKLQRKPFLSPYRSRNDWRLEVRLHKTPSKSSSVAYVHDCSG